MTDFDSDNLQPSYVSGKKITVLRTMAKPNDAQDSIEQKKTSFFGSALRRPKPDEVTVKPAQLIYEQVVFISGKLEIDFYRTTSYKIQIDEDVREVIIGETTFPILPESGVWEKVGKKMKEGVGVHKQDLVLPSQERVVETISDSMYLDCYGKVTNFQHHIDSKIVENYPKKILDIHEGNIRKIELTEDAIIQKLAQKIRTPLDIDIEVISQDFVVDEYTEIYLPIYEARAFDIKNREAVIRLDAVTGNILS